VATAEKGPQRTCVACRENKPQEQLVRYVVAPDGTLVVDYRQRLPGRGAYTCCDSNCLRTAIEKKQFQRSFRGHCQLGGFDSMLVQLRQALEQKIINLLGMGRKSSQVVSGSNAVITALRQGAELGVVLMTQDISPQIAGKIAALAERQQVDFSRLLSKDLLGQILGKGERSVVAVARGSLADAILIELHKYRQLVREN